MPAPFSIARAECAGITSGSTGKTKPIRREATSSNGGTRATDTVSPSGPTPRTPPTRPASSSPNLMAQRNGILPPAPAVETTQERTSLPSALDSYLEYVRYHRSLRTFRTYRPILESFKESCPKAYVDEVERP